MAGCCARMSSARSGSHLRLIRSGSGRASVIDSALVTYAAFVRPLSRLERETYYEEAKLVGGLLGLAGERYPAGMAEFDGYVAGMVAGDELVIDARARGLAAAVLRPPL